MATKSTVVSDHSSAPEQIEKVNDIQQEDLPSHPAPSSSAMEEKMEDKQVEPSLTKEVNKTDDDHGDDHTPAMDAPVGDKPETQAAEEQPKKAPKMEDKQVEPSLTKEVYKTDDDHYHTPALDDPVEDKPAAEEQPEEAPKMEDKQVVPSLTKEVNKTDDDHYHTPALDDPFGDKPAAEEQPEEAPKMEDVVELAVVAESDKNQPQEKSESESVGTQPPEQPAVEVVEKQREVEPATEAVEEVTEAAPKMGDVTEPSVVADSAEHQPDEKQPGEGKPSAMTVEKEPEKAVEDVSELPAVADSLKCQPEAQPASESIPQVEVAEKQPDIAPVERQPEEASKIGDVIEPPVAADSSKSPQEEQPANEFVQPIEVVEKQPAIDPVEKQGEDEPKIVDVTEASFAAVSAENKPEVQPVSEAVEVQKPAEVVEKQPEGQPKIDDTLQPSIETVEKTEQVEVLLVKESEAVEVIEIGSSESRPESKEAQELVPGGDNKPQEQPGAAEQVGKESAEIKPDESVKVEVANEKESSTDKIKGSQLEEEQKTTGEKPATTESVDQNTSTNVEAQIATKEDAGENPPTVVTENANIDDRERELSIVEGFPKEDVKESGKIELESEGSNVKAEEENEETKVMNEPKTIIVEDVSSTIASTEVAEKSLEEEKTSTDTELVAENGKESIENETVTSVDKNREMEAEADEVSATDVEEQFEEPQKSGTEVKGEETAQTEEANLEKEKEAGETLKPDAPTAELTKNGDDSKNSEEPPKEEITEKPSSKQSNSIMAKVKQSLVKAKKAIIGKSPNSKTVSSETKGDSKNK
ncbi:uncharacterized protein LOC127802485 isoform X2 [Diospyros lotus]|uniref:uncharacterized protein LOC127802485 isoform X2 n=1 Tax=Diospyros lotus TaxID=55363 RepID=UPI00225BE046|nr:uncharacterized protein LOC127802485 isoform X2 [Diospyros lotus]